MSHIICQLIAAGVEGGSKRTIEDEWTLADYAEMRDHWDRVGPPPYISLMLIASAHGAKFGQPQKHRSIPQATAEAVQGIAAQFGGEVRKYVPPRQGLIIDATQA